MKSQVIKFIESEIQCGNEVIISTCGNGGAGLTLISDIMLVQELKEMDYVGSNQPAEDIETYEDYDPEAYNVHRFNGKNGFYILVATYGINASKPVEDINNLDDTIMKEYKLTVESHTGSRYCYYGKTKKEAISNFKKAFGNFRGFVKKEWTKE